MRDSTKLNDVWGHIFVSIIVSVIPWIWGSPSEGESVSLWVVSWPASVIFVSLSPSELGWVEFEWVWVRAGLKKSFSKYSWVSSIYFANACIDLLIEELMTFNNFIIKVSHIKCSYSRCLHLPISQRLVPLCKDTLKHWEYKSWFKASWPVHSPRINFGAVTALRQTKRCNCVY